MNINHPNLRSTQEPPGPDYLGGAVLQALARPAYHKLTWGPLRTIVLGVASFGVLPILVWTKRFRQFVTLEQQQLWHLAEWLRLNSQDLEAAKLRTEAEGIRLQSDLRLLAMLCVAFLAIIFFTQLQPYRHHGWDALLDCTYLYPFYRLHPAQFHQAPLSTAFKLFNTWSLALSAAYVCHWLQVQVYAKSVGRFIGRFNAIARSEGLTPVTVQMPGAGLRPVWMVGAVILACTGNVWGVPMMLAGAAHRRLIRLSSRTNRAAMAHRLRAMLLARRPNENIAMPVYLRRLCANEKCRASVHESACFCRRCGTRVVPPLHQVA